MLFIVCALPCEAASLISYFHLKSYNKQSHFQIYLNTSIVLIISGVGKTRMASAVGYLQGSHKNLNHIAWLNVGIGGHSSLPVGTGMLGHKIIDQATDRTYYPAFVIDRPVKTTTIRTVDKQEFLYHDPDSIYEMEASSFWSAASTFSTAELIHCYKIVSDNQFDSPPQVNSKFVENLIKENLSNIKIFIDDLIDLSHFLSTLEISNNDLEPYLQRWHFTKTQEIQLKNLLNHLKAYSSNTLEKLWNANLLSLKESAHVLKYLENVQKTLPFTING